MWAQNRERRVNGQHGHRRAQSETIGFVLLLSLVLIGAGTIIAFGAVAVSDSQNSLSADRAEKVMTQMDSEISMVALGRTNSQEMEFDRASASDFTVDGEAGRINITTIGDNSTVIMPDTDLGAIVFERANTQVAYQGGGVWRSDSPNGSGMISPPEFNYRDQTLTLPLVTISGDRSLDGGAVVEKDGPSTSYFPNPKKDENLSNPLEDEIVQVTVESRFHQGWKSYFETRTEGAVTHEPAENRVSVNLTAPAEVEFEHAAVTTSATPPKVNSGNGNGNGNGNGGNNYKKEIVGSTRTGVSAPSVSPNVEAEIDNCTSGGDCTTITDLSSGTYTDSTYYSSGDLDVGSTSPTFDTSGGDISVVVDGELSFSGSTDLDIVGDGQVRFYVNESVGLSGTPNLNTGGDPQDLLVLVHSQADHVGDNGNIQMTGFVYAPNSDFDIKGGGNEKNVVGGVIANTINVGNGYLEQSNPENFSLELGAPVNVLTFLHISANPVTVRSQ